MDTKQVIVMRKDLNMRKGKMCAQASHASMAFITRNIRISQYEKEDFYSYGSPWYCLDDAAEITHWFQNSFRKICVYVNSREELLCIHQKAIESGLISNLITDNGATEFGGVPTDTCIAIGPHLDSKFVGITDHLPLL